MSFIPEFVGAALSYAGARHANKMNRRMAQEQMGFQERMSNTAYQRAVQDMRAAGINPMVAFSQGGASSPSGALSTMQNELSQGVTSGIEARRARAEFANLLEQNKLIKSQIALNSAQAVGVKSDTARKWVDTVTSGLSKAMMASKIGRAAKFLKFLRR